MITSLRPLPAHSRRLANRIRMTAFRAAMLSLCLGAGVGSPSVATAAEDPDVVRARFEAHQQYEAKKAAEKRMAIALTRQGIVALYNAGTGPISYSARWLLWDGSYTNWTAAKIEGRKSVFYSKAGGIKLQVKFSSAGGGQKNYALESAQVPSDIKAGFDDAAPNNFVWGANNSLDLFKGKPKNW